ncbi:hypothetical protein RIVM261_057650 [Rivularia sp. IAM M-261]|nr:hypothetical protein CAL7716_032680 [Calothrix sp. PCC 7716]GJD20809.1 hypothetical protein RIVM261_057650 [Rivularia sp. IAM M-261]
MLSETPSRGSLVLNTDDGIKTIMQLPTVTARQEGATELRIFLLEEEKELVKQVVAKKSITLSHLVRQLLLAWASEQSDNESKAS